MIDAIYYKNILEEYSEKMNKLRKILNIPSSSWIHEALGNSEKLLAYLNHSSMPYLLDAHSKDDCTLMIYSIKQIEEVTKFIYFYEGTEFNTKKSIFNKLKKILGSTKMPLIPGEENKNTNEGRNYMFELRIFGMFYEKGYDVVFPKEDHPDIEIITKYNQYSIECKRVFSSKSFISNIKRGIYQLEKYSLSKRNKFGIIAVNISRFFTNQTQIMIAESQRDATNLILSDYQNFIRSTLPAFQLIQFPVRIPILLFEYYGYGYIDNDIKSVRFTDFVDSKSYSSGISLYNVLIPDFGRLKSDFLFV